MARKIKIDRSQEKAEFWKRLNEDKVREVKDRYEQVLREAKLINKEK